MQASGQNKDPLIETDTDTHHLYDSLQKNRYTYKKHPKNDENAMLRVRMNQSTITNIVQKL